MKFGVNTFIWGAAFGPSDFHLLPEIKANGFDGVEVPILDPGTFDAAAVGRELDRIGLERTAVTIVPGGTSLASSDAGLRQRAITHLEAAIAAARDAGATILAGPMFTPVGYLTGVRRTSEEWKWVVDSWQRLAPAVNAAGIEIALEPLNRFETYFLNTAADATTLCDEMKEIGYDRWLTIESFGFALGPLSAAAAIWRDLAPTPETIAFSGVKFLRAQTQQPQLEHS
jgi:D-psicose/D-tagatose/L-ribulose 3-epimerase